MHTLLAVVALVSALAVVANARAVQPRHEGVAQVGGMNVRVQALSASLVRIEPQGPRGFESNTTFMVVNRSFVGLPMSQTGNATHAVFTTAYYVVVLTQSPAPPSPPSMCSAHTNNDITNGARVPSCLNKEPCLSGVTQDQCCGNCSSSTEGCSVWIYQPSQGSCWLMEEADGYHPASDRNCGGNFGPSPSPTGISASVYSPSGALLWTIPDLDAVGQNLNWPSPTQSAAYAIMDYPRFYVPPWGPTPAPPNVDPELRNTR
jgi:hypothetical protein